MNEYVGEEKINCPQTLHNAVKNHDDT